jgi:hypothetical protein
MLFCHVDGGDDPTKRDTDPFEALLALCRVLGIDYDIRQNPDTGNWSCKLTPILDWPADFFGGAGSQGGRRSFTGVGCKSKLDAVNFVLPMVIGSMHRSCMAWREIAKTHPEYVKWFERDAMRTKEGTSR